MAWDDAPPTPQELAATAPISPSPVATPAGAWHAAAPTPQELAAVGATTPEVPSGTEALARGALQGATLGFQDELQGGGQALFDKLVGSDGGKSMGDLYSQHVAEARAANDAAQKAHPYLYGGGNLAGGLASGIATGGLGAETALGRMGVAAGMGAASGVGYGNPSDLRSGASDALKGASVGGAMGAAGEALGSVLSGDAASATKSTAENLAENATGATGSQAMKFRNQIVDPSTGTVLQKGAGRELLDRGFVGAGDSQADIAAKAAEALQQSGKGIEDSVAALDAQGAQPVTKVDILKYIQNKINNIGSSPSQVGEATALKKVAQDVANGPDVYTLAEAEQEKQGFDTAAKWSSTTDAPTREGAKVAANAFRDTVEKNATAANPDLAAQFMSDKDTYNLLKPIQTAAEKRAATTNQSPLGGLLDLGSAAGAVVSGHPLLAPVMAIGRRVVAPRLASTMAVGADKLGDILQKAPEMLGPWASQLSAAAARGPTSLAATNMILSQTNEAYRTHMKGIFGDNQ